MEAARAQVKLGAGRARERSRKLLGVLPDERLVERARGGSEAAFATLFERHYRSILSYCRQMLGGREEAEDAVQQTFVNAYRDMVRGDRDRELRFRPWLYRIARNHCISVLRARRVELELPDSEPSLVGLSEEVAGRRELRELLGDLAALPLTQREALVLAELHDNSHTEVARILGCDREKVKSLVFQARSSLMKSREARTVSCEDIQRQLSVLRGGSLRRSLIRRHLELCEPCRRFSAEVRRQRQAMAVVLPVIPSVALKAGAAEAAAAVGVKAVATHALGSSTAGGVSAASGASAAGGTGAIVGGSGSGAAGAGGGAAATGASGSLAALGAKLGSAGLAVKGTAAAVAVTAVAAGGSVGVKGLREVVDRKPASPPAAAHRAPRGVPRAGDTGAGPQVTPAPGSIAPPGARRGARSNEFSGRHGKGPKRSRRGAHPGVPPGSRPLRSGQDQTNRGRGRGRARTGHRLRRSAGAGERRQLLRQPKTRDLLRQPKKRQALRLRARRHLRAVQRRRLNRRRTRPLARRRLAPRRERRAPPPSDVPEQRSTAPAEPAPSGTP